MNLPKGWKQWRTCSRVHGGACTTCKELTYFGFVTGPGKKPHCETLCLDCAAKRFEPEEHARKIAEAEKGRLERNAIVEDERARRKRGDPPPDGWERSGAYLIRKFSSTAGLHFREMLEIECPVFPDVTAVGPMPMPLGGIAFYEPRYGSKGAVEQGDAAQKS